MDRYVPPARRLKGTGSGRLFTLIIVLVLILGGIWFLTVVTAPQKRLPDEIPNLPEQGQVPNDAQIENKPGTK